MKILINVLLLLMSLLNVYGQEKLENSNKSYVTFIVVQNYEIFIRGNNVGIHTNIIADTTVYFDTELPKIQLDFKTLNNTLDGPRGDDEYRHLDFALLFAVYTSDKEKDVLVNPQWKIYQKNKNNELILIDSSNHYFCVSDMNKFNNNNNVKYTDFFERSVFGHIEFGPHSELERVGFRTEENPHLKCSKKYHLIININLEPFVIPMTTKSSGYYEYIEAIKSKEEIYKLAEEKENKRIEMENRIEGPEKTLQDANWIYFGQHLGTNYYYNSNSLIYDADSVDVWIKTEFESELSKEVTGKLNEFQNILFCKNQRFVYIFSKTENVNGNIKYITTRSDFKSLIPDYNNWYMKILGKVFYILFAINIFD